MLWLQKVRFLYSTVDNVFNCDNCFAYLRYSYFFNLFEYK